MTSSTQAATRLALIFGTDNYSCLPDLRCSRADVEAVAEVLGDPTRGAFVVRQGDSEASANDIMGLIESEAGALGPGDTLLLYFSGHALQDAQDKLYLGVMESDPNRLATTAIGLTRVLELIDSCSASGVVVILDACFSGAVAHSFRVMVGRRDMWVITSSTSDQQSYEKEGDEYSIFTGYFLDGLRYGFADLDNTGDISVSEAYNYAERLVRAAGREATSPNQEPMLFIPSGTRGDLHLAGNPRRRDIDLSSIAELPGFVAAPGMAYAVNNSLPWQFEVLLLKKPQYLIEGTPYRAFALTVAFDYTPNFILLNDGFESDCFFPPHMLAPEHREGKQVVNGIVRVRLKVEYEAIGSVLALRVVDGGVEDSAVEVMARVTQT